MKHDNNAPCYDVSVTTGTTTYLITVRARGGAALPARERAHRVAQAAAHHVTGPEGLEPCGDVLSSVVTGCRVGAS